MKSGEKRNRRSIRLPGYDYTNSGANFVTIRAQDRQCVFGDISGEEMVLSNAGQMVQTVWKELPGFYPGVGIDAFQIMPNHIHGIIVLVGATPRGCPRSGQAQGPAPTFGQPWGGVTTGRPQGVAPTGGQSSGVGISLPDVVHRFKTMTTRKYAEGVKQDSWPPFPGKLWQRNYYEHVVRNDEELSSIREYVLNNPKRWHLDRENPIHATRKK